MLMIRLSRIGKRGQPYFRVVVVEHTKKTKGKYLELLGTYNPHEKVFQVKKDRVEYWMSKGAQASPTVNNLLVNHKIWDKPKVQSWKPKKKPTTNDQQPTTKVEVPKEESAPAEAQLEAVVS
ncbi:MAG: 30S ribosomal protein S16 [Candidatus Yanofskybacteria bacterium RIFCSPLOWO2_01_FULL_41_34]|uniref:Small ribosomal subunit protein bS16 n=1 Tax=Candidatus Yanofskybacteria bacterium RIFCSPHIGHO2_01_FULL_41_26 TaxID=1802661 RepID=A0A1F8EDW7_9BACT|nr:MAG: 30S ribosomal protein S16 [Candidatus Yanofskybacteria bacterium RIFCSPHIGHO2_01_FULL_41_26]OGN21131.1 MAG: 30S ribosomal protein S16 [Candidatus Yanofskybacteria bacterium RIFCSPLOWO2_01_FULL_41_34]